MNGTRLQAGGPGQGLSMPLNAGVSSKAPELDPELLQSLLQQTQASSFVAAGSATDVAALTRLSVDLSVGPSTFKSLQPRARQLCTVKLVLGLLLIVMSGVPHCLTSCCA